MVDNKNIRAFLAFDLDPVIRNKIASILKELQSLSVNVKWVRLEHLHVTIKFLGNISIPMIEQVRSMMQASGRTNSLNEVKCKSLQIIPHVVDPRIVWIAIENKEGNICSLVESFEGPLEQIGIPKMKNPYSPHITLGRVKAKKNISMLDDYCQEYKFDEAFTYTIPYLTLYKSTLTPHGPEYQVLEKMDLLHDQ